MDFSPHIILKADGYNHLAGTVSLKRADASRLDVPHALGREIEERLARAVWDWAERES